MTPKVSVIMANYNAAAYLREAVASVLAQTVAPLELIVADDASTDGSLDVLRSLADDSRVSVIEADRNAGPGAARNRALDAARGEWLAIVDSDDVIAPDRIARLIAVAEAGGADAVADDLAYFGDPETEGTTLMAGHVGAEPWELSAEAFLKAHLDRFALPPLGYLKPVFRREALGALRYDAGVRIGEDSDFLLRFLLAGHRMVLVPDALYRYRRHPGSVSHRLTPEALAAMIGNARALMPSLTPAMAALMEERCVAMDEALVFETMVRDLKARRIGPAMGALAARPRLAARLARAVRQGLGRRARAMAR